jgi:hypothetical protein
MKILFCHKCGWKAEIPKECFIDGGQRIVVCTKCGEESNQYNRAKDAINNWNYRVIFNKVIRHLCVNWECPGFTIKWLTMCPGITRYMATKHINSMIRDGLLKTFWLGGCNEDGPMRPVRLIESTSKLRETSMYIKADKQASEDLKKAWGC